MQITLDESDVKLLEVLQKDNRLTADELGELTGKSRSSVQRRLKRLREEGVIEADISVLSPRALGNFMTFIVEVELEVDRTQHLDEFRRSMLSLENVQQCYYITGRTDFIVIAVSPDMESYEEFCRQVFTENPNIRRFHSNVVVNRVKVGLNVPLRSS